VNSVNDVAIELVVVLGRSEMPIHQLLRMGRGAVIELGTRENDEVQIMANDVPIARGEIVLDGDRIGVSVTKKLTQSEVLALQN
jgi:flagellar motor switch protein FliN/FliY